MQTTRHTEQDSVQRTLRTAAFSCALDTCVRAPSIRNSTGILSLPLTGTAA